MKEKRLYIAYGSNLNLEQMSVRCPTASVVGTARVMDYELLFRGGRRGAVATIEPLKNSSVPVMVWEIEPRDERALDLYEGAPNFYRKEMMEVELEGNRILAMVYLMNDGHSFGSPSDYYLETIKEGYLTAGFDTDELDRAVEHSMELARQEQEQETQLRQGNLFGQKWW